MTFAHVPHKLPKVKVKRKHWNCEDMVDALINLADCGSSRSSSEVVPPSTLLRYSHKPTIASIFVKRKSIAKAEEFRLLIQRAVTEEMSLSPSDHRRKVHASEEKQLVDEIALACRQFRPMSASRIRKRAADIIAARDRHPHGTQMQAYFHDHNHLYQLSSSSFRSRRSWGCKRSCSGA